MHEKIKHFDNDVHLVKEKVASGLIKTVKVDSKENVADILIKALGSFQHSYLTKKFGMGASWKYGLYKLKEARVSYS
ncbi:hypothetical protein Tco_0758301 [Tanacetum coccineum]